MSVTDINKNFVCYSTDDFLSIQVICLLPKLLLETPLYMFVFSSLSGMLVDSDFHTFSKLCDFDSFTVWGYLLKFSHGWTMVVATNINLFQLHTITGTYIM